MTLEQDVSPDVENQEDRPESEPPEPEAPGSLPPGQLYRVAWVFYLVIAVAGLVWVGLREGDLSPRLFARLETLPLDLGLGLAAAALILGLWEVARRLLPQAAEMETYLKGLIGPLPLDEAFAIALLSGFAEELFFRAAVQGSLGWPLATLLFALLHAGGGRALRLWPVFAAVAGLAFAGLMLWRGSLLAPATAHIAINAFSLWRMQRGAS